MNYQIAFVDQISWAAIGPGCSTSGLFQFSPLPLLDCPVLDIRECDPERVSSACRRYHPSPELSIDVKRLVRFLVKAGARRVQDHELRSDRSSFQVEQPGEAFLDAIQAQAGWR